MKSLMLLLIAMCLALGVTGAHAENGCPPGMIPYSGTDVRSCGPLPPGYQQQQAARPKARWVSQWQAIAGDSELGILGTSAGKLVEDDAISAAISDCKANGGKNCTFKISAANGCIAMAVGTERVSYRSGTTKGAAESAALGECSEVSKDCRIYYSSCDMAKLVEL